MQSPSWYNKYQHNNQRNKLSAQYKQNFTRLTSSSLKMVSNGSDNDPSPLPLMSEPCCQENSGMQESLRLPSLSDLTTKESTNRQQPC